MSVSEESRLVIRRVSKALGFVLVLGALSVQTSLAAPTARSDFDKALYAKPDVAHGAELFATCAKCHGPSGNGADDGSIPRIAGQHFRVLVRQLVDYRHELRWDIRMEHYAGRDLLRDSQSIADVAAYVSQLARDAPRNVGDGTLVAHGSRVYSLHCAECHGPVGEGEKLSLVPRIAGQHYAYLLRQIYDGVDGRRPNFSNAHVKILARLDRNDIVGIADFLSRSEWTGPRDSLAGRGSGDSAIRR
jgi:cytochrome c553